MKKILFVFVFLFSMMSVIPIAASRLDFDVQDGVLIKYNGNEKDVIIPRSRLM